MKSGKIIKPDFLIIGAQKSGTTWLWAMLKSHPGTDLPSQKEIHFFGSSELHSKGTDWYYNHFRHLNSSKVVGEASPTYLYDNIPYWYNPTRNLEHDKSLPTIPELITNELPNIKIIMILRDPVKRAVSAYTHLAREKRLVSPFYKLKESAENNPKYRIVELGYYARYIALWKKFVPPERMCILIFEQDILISPEEAIKNIYRFLELDVKFKPDNLRTIVHKSWGWTRILLNYYAGPLTTKVINKRPANWVLSKLDRFDPLKHYTIKKKDVEFLRSAYLPEKNDLESLIGRKLDCWSYTV